MRPSGVWLRRLWRAARASRVEALLAALLVAASVLALGVRLANRWSGQVTAAEIGGLVAAILIAVLVYAAANRQANLRRSHRIQTGLERSRERLDQKLQERSRELATLLDVSGSLGTTLELPLLLQRILEYLQQVVDYDGANVLVLEGDQMRNVAHRGPIPQELRARMQFNREQAGPLWEAMQGHQPLIISDVRGDSALAQAFRQAMGEHLDVEMSYVRTWVGVPLMVQERLIGWLSLHHRQPRAYLPHQVTLAQIVGNQAATAIESARLHDQARRVAVLEERQRLARELHDSVSQVLYGVGLGARTARALLDRAAVAPAQATELAEPLDYVLSLAEAGLAEMRALIFELRPDSLEREGLVAALSRQAGVARARHRLQVHTEFCPEPALPLEAKEALYRISQEAVHNIVRHAQASRVEIRLMEDQEGVTLEIEDDGVGFEPRPDYPGHMGMHSMRERAGRLGGRLTVDSALGGGTRIRVSARPAIPSAG